MDFWTSVVAYPLFVRQNFVMCSHLSLTNFGELPVKKVSRNSGIGVRRYPPLILL